MDAGSVACVFIPLGVALAFIVGMVLYFNYIRNLNRKFNEELYQAYESYRQSLELLKQHPSNPDLRQRALEWGRHYSNLTRDKKGITVYDEVALANDINAACAGAGNPARDSAATATRSIEQRLDQLKTLFNQGAIDEAEYRERRGKLLDEV